MQAPQGDTGRPDLQLCVPSSMEAANGVSCSMSPNSHRLYAEVHAGNAPGCRAGAPLGEGAGRSRSRSLTRPAGTPLTEHALTACARARAKHERKVHQPQSVQATRSLRRHEYQRQRAGAALDIWASQRMRGAQRGKFCRRAHGARAAPTEAGGGERRGRKGKCMRDVPDGCEREKRRCAHAHVVCG